jgi:cell division protein FtsZ
VAPAPEPVLQTAVFEPVRATTYPAPRPVVEAQPAAAAPEPTVIQPQVRPIARIVDPSVADEDEAGPLFPESSNYGDERRQKGGWLSIFGRPRHDPAPAPTLRSSGSAQPSSQPAHQTHAAEDPDDLEIPSFLRRLAN